MSSSNGASSKEDNDSASSYRLPRTLIPSLYRLTLTPDLDAATFAGKVSVDLKASSGTSEVVLNALDVQVDKVEVEEGENKVPVKGHELDEEHEMLRISLGEEVRAGSEVTLRLEYRGKLNDQMRGFYRTVQDTPKGKENAASCHFEVSEEEKMSRGLLCVQLKPDRIVIPVIMLFDH